MRENTLWPDINRRVCRGQFRWAEASAKYFSRRTRPTEVPWGGAAVKNGLNTIRGLRAANSARLFCMERWRKSWEVYRKNCRGRRHTWVPPYGKVHRRWRPSISGGQSRPPLRMDRRCGRRKKNTAATKKFRARQCFMLTKQARLWYNETLYWENGANTPFQPVVMIPAFPRNYKWNSAKTNNSPPRVKSVESRSLRKSTEKMRKERREY